MNGSQFSPDGHRLAYVSNEPGGTRSSSVRSAGGRKRLSSEGGVAPAWAPAGRELFFSKDDKLCVVGLDSDRNPAGRDRIPMTVPKFEGLEFDAGTSTMSCRMASSS